MENIFGLFLEDILMKSKVVEKSPLILAIIISVLLTYMFIDTRSIRLFECRLDLVIIVSFVCFLLVSIMVEHMASCRSSDTFFVTCGIGFIVVSAIFALISNSLGYSPDAWGPIFIILTITSIVIFRIGFLKGKKWKLKY